MNAMSSCKSSKNPTGQMCAREKINLSQLKCPVSELYSSGVLCSEIPPVVGLGLSHRGAGEQGRRRLGGFVFGAK